MSGPNFLPGVGPIKIKTSVGPENLPINYYAKPSTDNSELIRVIKAQVFEEIKAKVFEKMEALVEERVRVEFEAEKYRKKERKIMRLEKKLRKIKEDFDSEPISDKKPKSYIKKEGEKLEGLTGYDKDTGSAANKESVKINQPTGISPKVDIPAPIIDIPAPKIAPQQYSPHPEIPAPKITPQQFNPHSEISAPKIAPQQYSPHPEIPAPKITPQQFNPHSEIPAPKIAPQQFNPLSNIPPSIVDIPAPNIEIPAPKIAPQQYNPIPNIPPPVIASQQPNPPPLNPTPNLSFPFNQHPNPLPSIPAPNLSFPFNQQPAPPLNFTIAPTAAQENPPEYYSHPKREEIPVLPDNSRSIPPHVSSEPPALYPYTESNPPNLQPVPFEPNASYNAPVSEPVPIEPPVISQPLIQIPDVKKPSESSEPSDSVLTKAFLKTPPLIQPPPLNRTANFGKPQLPVNKIDIAPFSKPLNPPGNNFAAKSEDQTHAKLESGTIGAQIVENLKVSLEKSLKNEESNAENLKNSESSLGKEANNPIKTDFSIYAQNKTEVDLAAQPIPAVQPSINIPGLNQRVLSDPHSKPKENLPNLSIPGPFPNIQNNIPNPIIPGPNIAKNAPQGIPNQFPGPTLQNNLPNLIIPGPNIAKNAPQGIPNQFPGPTLQNNLPNLIIPGPNIANNPPQGIPKPNLGSNNPSSIIQIPPIQGKQAPPSIISASKPPEFPGIIATPANNQGTNVSIPPPSILSSKGNTSLVPPNIEPAQGGTFTAPPTNLTSNPPQVGPFIAPPPNFANNPPQGGMFTQPKPNFANSNQGGTLIVPPPNLTNNPPQGTTFAAPSPNITNNPPQGTTFVAPPPNITNNAPQGTTFVAPPPNLPNNFPQGGMFTQPKPNFANSNQGNMNPISVPNLSTNQHSGNSSLPPPLILPNASNQGANPASVNPAAIGQKTNINPPGNSANYFSSPPLITAGKPVQVNPQNIFSPPVQKDFPVYSVPETSKFNLPQRSNLPQGDPPVLPIPNAGLQGTFSAFPQGVNKSPTEENIPSLPVQSLESIPNQGSRISIQQKLPNNPNIFQNLSKSSIIMPPTGRPNSQGFNPNLVTGQFSGSGVGGPQMGLGGGDAGTNSDGRSQGEPEPSSQNKNFYPGFVKPPDFNNVVQ